MKACTVSPPWNQYLPKFRWRPYPLNGAIMLYPVKFLLISITSIRLGVTAKYMAQQFCFSSASHSSPSPRSRLLQTAAVIPSDHDGANIVNPTHKAFRADGRACGSSIWRVRRTLREPLTKGLCRASFEIIRILHLRPLTASEGRTALQIAKEYFSSGLIFRTDGCRRRKQRNAYFSLSVGVFRRR